jgi:hypothetical protein
MREFPTGPGDRSYPKCLPEGLRRAPPGVAVRAGCSEGAPVDEAHRRPCSGANLRRFHMIREDARQFGDRAAPETAIRR